MRTFYNVYCFSYDTNVFVYNPTITLYFMKAFQGKCAYPQNILDSNLSMDRNKIAYISQLPNGENVILGALEEKELSISRIADSFGLEDMLSEAKNDVFMISLLYYFGVLTIKGKTALGELSMKIPNLVVRKLYVEEIQKRFLPSSRDKNEIIELARNFYTTGNLEPLCDFVEAHYFKVFDNRDYRWSNELTVKTAFLTLLFNDLFYIMDSEAVLERSYADLTMIIRPDMRKYKLLDFLIEFKYVSLRALDLSSKDIKQLTREELKSLQIVNQKLSEAKIKLKNYQKALYAKYGAKLRLHTYSIVAIGFERVVWEKLE